MDPNLQEIVDASITLETAVATAAGFGEPLLLTPTTHFAERVRRYSKASDMVADGFDDEGPEYLAVSRLLSQQPKRVKTVALGRRTSIPTQRFAVTPVAVNSAKYRLKVDDTWVEYTSDASATVAEIIAALKTAIDALGKAVTTSDQTTFLRVVANTPGAFVSLRADNIDRLKVVQDHTEAGLNADLDAISTEDNAWYAILNPFNSDAEIATISAWVESNEKLFLAQSQSGYIPTAATDDIASIIKGLTRYRTAIFYHPETKAWFDAAIAGTQLPKEPGSSTWARKSVTGVDAPALTATHRTNLNNKNVSFYQSVAGLGDVFGGKVAAGEWIDIIRDRDWQVNRIATGVYTSIHRAEKLPMDDNGIRVVVEALRSALQDGEDAGFLKENPKFTIIAPAEADLSDADLAARSLPDVHWEAKPAGAIHAVTIGGVLSL